MARVKNTKSVTLRAPGVGSKQFSVSHAERLLAMRKNGGWYLPGDSDYELNAEGGLVLKQKSKKEVKDADNTGNKKTPQKSSESDGASESGAPSE